VIELLGVQRLEQLLDVVGRYRVVEIADAEGALNFFDSRLEWNNRALFFIDFVVRITVQTARD
jgi:hypothetical protein